MKQHIPPSQSLMAGMTKQQDGCEYIYLYSAAARTAKTPYWHSTNDASGIPTAEAITLGAKNKIGYVVFATETATSAGYQWFTMKGIVDEAIVDTGSYVALDMIGLYDSACTPSTATTVTPDDFAVSLETASTTTPDIYLLGREIIVDGA